ncbi:hypothetical protein CCMSSC00406_0000837 [Pleurotus cornucopiae]|uniref:Uncharacterized protein n=1 Tax=Pleurotus cornucopiae TaxID=5321 RepID=A0ACB7JA90_PLECO|nr:hypothetical protein CCMSSC00406_0000837 [Pleurotus cornucopiae]
MSEYLLAFKAGRAFRNEGTNRVEPSATKGAIILTNGDDGLLHFIWKNRSTNQIEEDLILFPTDASFVKVSQATSGRVYVLKFSSSNQRHFFWLQDASDERDAKFVENLNGLLQDPEHTLDWSSDASSAQASTSQVPQATPEQLAQIQRIVQSMSGSTQPSAPELSLTDILTPDNLRPLFTSRPELIPALFPHLPPDLPLPPSTEVLERVIHSPQFRASVASFDQALRTGLLGGLVRGLGLPEEAGTSVEAFLRAIQEQADRGDSMETD